MKNIINKYRKKAWEAAKERGIIDDNFLLKIFWNIVEEIVELKKSLNNQKARLKRFEDIIDKNSDSFFTEYFEIFIKNTQEDEIADIFICCLTFLEEYSKKEKIKIFDIKEERSFVRLIKNSEEKIILPKNDKSLEYNIRRLIRVIYDTFSHIKEKDFEIKINVFLWSLYLLSKELDVNLDKHLKYKIKYNFLRKD